MVKNETCPGENMEVSLHNGQLTEITEKLEKSLSMDTDDKMDAYHRYIKDGKDIARQGEMSKALELFKLAYSIHPSEKLKNRINKIEEVLAQQGSESEDEEFVNINNSGLMLFKELHDKLYSHQREGVAFLYSLYRDGRKGGILADDMGLGKTIQVISFLSGMYDAEHVKHTLLVMPTSLITNWTKEFAKWTPGMRVKEFHGTSKVERTRNLEKIQRRGGVIITTYQMLINNWQVLASYHGQEFKWDFMILDEAHKIKTTSTKTAKSAYAIPAKNRVLLTGTPVQNNLREMWALFDFACQGTLLGTSKTFKTEYENPITRAREKDATPGEKALGLKMSENLMAIIKPYFLRRTKADVQKKKMNGTEVCIQQHSGSDNKDNPVPNHETESGAVMPTLTRKNDLIVWTFLSAVQEDIYRQFLSLDHIKELLMTTRSPLAELNILKKLCDHPRLLSAAAIAQLGLEESAAERQQGDDGESAAHSIAGVPDETLISESGKLVFLLTLLEKLKEEGHRTLVFAHFRTVLDIIERVLVNRGFKIVRLDGTITQLAERERRISLFQTDKRYSVFLLTTQVGGVGITLTAANRVVIYDPSWNPATDAQAVDRAYRIGQTENVVIYRLITCGTVEEKIYRRQVFKDSLIRQTTGDKKNPFRYFSKQELKELFTLEDTRSSTTQLQLQSLHSRHRRTDPELDEHIAHLHTMDMFGISDHDLMFSLDVNNHDEAPEDEEAHQYIEGRVQKAQELVKAESELQMQLAESMADSTEPAWLRQTAQHNRERSNEKKPRNSRPSPAFPQKDDNFSRSPVLVELDQSASGEDHDGQNQNNMVIDLTVNESMTEEQPVPEVSQDKLADLNLDSPKQQSFKKEQSDFEAGDASVLEVVDESFAASDAVAAAPDDASVEYVESIVYEDEKQQNGSFHSNHNDSNNQDFAVDEQQPHLTPLVNKRLSMLQMSNASLKADTSSKVSAGFESFEGNFNLQLEDSDMFPEMEEQETEAQERTLLSQLQMEGSFNVDKSLCERADKQEAEQSINGSHVSELNGSADDSIITSKKKRAAVIYDSEDCEEEEDDDGQPSVRSRLEESFQVLGASTPKLVRSGSTPVGSRKSFGGNTSVASRRSLVQSIIEDVENLDEDEDDENNGDDDYEEDVSEHSDVTEGEYVSASSSDNLKLEETNGETLNTEDEEESEESGESADSNIESASGEEMASNPEESTSDPELASHETMDQCTADPAVTSNVLADVKPPSESEDGSYDFLVRRGKQCYSEGKLDEALSFFLRAIDITPGDPEIQLMTIQLYRKLSQTAKN